MKRRGLIIRLIMKWVRVRFYRLEFCTLFFINMKQVTSNQVDLLSNKNLSFFLELYEEHYETLLIYSYLILRDESRANQAIRTAFNKLWEHPEKLQHSPDAYSVLFTEVKVITHFLRSEITL